MRVQLQDQTLRLRLQEAEFRTLLGGGTVENRTVLPEGGQAVQQIRLAETVEWHADGATWRIALPAAEVHAYGKRLPTREGLHFIVSAPHGTSLDIRFDVDVRDSARQRAPGSPGRNPR